MALTKIGTDGVKDDAVTVDKIADSINSTRAANTAKTGLADNAVTNAKVNASAAIAGTKIAPDFGSQNVTTSGNITSSAGTISTTNGAITANKGTNNQVVIGHDGAIEISRNNGGAFIDFKSDTSEDHDARIQENSGGFTLSGTCSATTFSGSGASLTNLPAANLTGALPAISGANLTGLGGGVPTGCILLWSGATNAIPTGYAICDGNNGTPDLRNRFLLGAGDTYAVGAVGGNESATIATANLPSHDHTFSGTNTHSHPYNRCYPHSPQRGSQAGGGAYSYVRFSTSDTTSDTTITVSGTTAAVGGGVALDIRPKYYSLAYIMKT